MSAPQRKRAIASRVIRPEAAELYRLGAERILQALKAAVDEGKPIRFIGKRRYLNLRMPPNDSSER